MLSAELIAEAGSVSRFRSADALAAAAGIAPVLRQSGKVRFLRRPTGGNKGLKRVFYQSAFCSLGHPDSRAFYDGKRREGKRHHQAIIALARRRINVLWAMLNSRQPFQQTSNSPVDACIRLPPGGRPGDDLASRAGNRPRAARVRQR